MKKYLSLLFATMALTAASFAQSTTSGDISGTLTDPTGAVIPNAKVTVSNTATGDTKTVTTSASGTYRISLLQPGQYRVSATAAGFTTTQNEVTVAVGTIASDDIKLSVGQGTTTVEVSAAPPTVNTENADITTTFTAEQVQSLPNPGNDLTFVAQTAPGSVMNTGTSAGGYGNFSSFGISGLSNMFTLDGGYENDPFLNLNNTGASNLTLGNNEVDTVTIVAPAYSSQFGGLGGAQVNEITQSGTNHIHGKVNYYWNGRALNANDFFNKQAETFYGQKNLPTFVNANQWAASIGGPALKDKLFWYVNTEGIRAITPQNANINVPNMAAQNCSMGVDGASNSNQNSTVIPYDHYILNDYFGTTANPTPFGTSDVSVATYTQALLGTNGYSSCGSLNVNADIGASAAYYNTYYNTGTPVPTNNPGQLGFLGEGGIPFVVASATNQALLKTVYGVFNNSPLRATTPIQNPNDPTAQTYYAKNSALLKEWLLTARIDYKLGDKDNFFVHYKQDHGTQPTYTDLVDPRFTSSSVQPAWEGQISESHSFTPNFVNQLVLTGNYYSAPFENDNNYQPVEPLAISAITGTWATYGGENYVFPQGRRVAGYQVIDDVSYNRGRNTIRWGYNIRRDNVTTIKGPYTVSPLALGTVEGFISGQIDYEYVQRFPVHPTEPISVYNQGAYVEDTYKVTPTFTVTAGLRLERNSNPTCHTNCFSVLAQPVESLATSSSNPTSANTPYSAAFPGGYIQSNRYRAFTNYQKVGIEPRVSFNYQVTPKTIVRGGFGIFTDTFPALVADTLSNNAPNQLRPTVYGYVSGASNVSFDLNPASPNSATAAAIASANNFRTGFASGGTYATVRAATLASSGYYAVPSFSTPSKNVKYPTYEEFSLGIDQMIDRKTSVSILYVGNHGYHEPVSNASPNIANSKASATFFANVPKARPVTAFNTLTNIYSGASSNYNGVVFSTTRRSKDLTVQFNYQYSKAMDEVSNGGFEPFAPDAGDSGALVNPYNLHSNYGPADYNTKHNVTGTWVYQLPSIYRGDNALVKNLVGGFELSGAVFHNSGLPYSITQSTTAGGQGIAGSFSSGSVMLLSRQLNNNFDHHCGGAAHVALPDTTVPTPCNFTASFGNPTAFAQQSRNSLVGPSYTNVDFGAFKTFGMPVHYLESTKLKLGAQFFNLFNHTNFQNPAHARGSNNSSLGGITGTVGAPTSILGSVGGADASPRLIQLHASLVF